MVLAISSRCRFIASVLQAAVEMVPVV